MKLMASQRLQAADTIDSNVLASLEKALLSAKAITQPISKWAPARSYMRGTSKPVPPKDLGVFSEVFEDVVYMVDAIQATDDPTFLIVTVDMQYRIKAGGSNGVTSGRFLFNKDTMQLKSHR